MSFKAEIKASLGWNWSDGATDNRRLDYVRQLLDGNGDGQAEAVWHAEEQTLPEAASSTLDLTELTRMILGDTHTVSFLTVKALLIVNHGNGDGELLLGGAEEDEWSESFGADGDQVVVPPDSPLLLAGRRNGWTVNASHRNLKLASLAGDVTYSIAIVGTTTAGQSGSGSGA